LGRNVQLLKITPFLGCTPEPGMDVKIGGEIHRHLLPTNNKYLVFK
jgi:hypothetical protein